MKDAQTRPLLCRLNLLHKWRAARSEDGTGRYLKGARCGKEKPGGSIPPSIGIG